MIKDKLQILLITYNRKQQLTKTLDCLLSKESPIRNFDITVLDNASTDGSSELLERYSKKHSNLKHIRHKINIGGDANICRAFELGASSGKEYVWVLCDDDKYDFSNWKEVEKAIEDNKDIICLSDYVFPTQQDKFDLAYQIFQLTFVPAGIYKTALFTDTVLTNMYNAIYTCFQQSCIALAAINHGAKIHVLSRPIVFNGLHFEDKVTDVSLTRGSTRSEALPRRQDTIWILGYANILGLLKDKNLHQRCLEVSISYKDIYENWNHFYNCMYAEFINIEKLNYFYEIFKELPKMRQQELLSRYYITIKNVCCNILSEVIPDKKQIKKIKKISEKFIENDICENRIKYIMQSIFSIKNTHDKQYKIIKILGIKIKLKRNKNGKK